MQERSANSTVKRWNGVDPGLAVVDDMAPKEAVHGSSRQDIAGLVLRRRAAGGSDGGKGQGEQQGGKLSAHVSPPRSEDCAPTDARR